MEKRLKAIELIIDIMFGIFGIPLVIISMYSIFRESYIRNFTVETTANVVNCEKNIEGNNNFSYTVTISYMVNTTKYSNKYIKGHTFNPPKEGDQVKILYSKNNPNKIYPEYDNDNDAYSAMLFFGILGLPFALQFIIAIENRIRNLSRKKLINYGEQINAEILGVENNANYSVNGHIPYRITCEGNNVYTGEKMIFKSFNMWTNPEIIISERGIKSFPVYIDPKNPKRYYMDLDEIKGEIIYSVYL